MRKCPLCGQRLPQSITESDIRQRERKLAAPLLADENKRLKEQFEEEYHNRLAERENQLRIKAETAARAEVRREVARLKAESSEVKKRLERSEREHAQELRQIQRRSEEDARRLVQIERGRVEKEAQRRERQAIHQAARQHELRVKEVEHERENDRARYKIQNDRLQLQVAELSRRLERTQSEQLGEEAEVDLFGQLTAQFPQDRIERVGKGVKGADIIQHVNEGAKIQGRIVYESKNVSSWQNAFIQKAKECQRRYNTPYVVVVTKTLPRKQKGLCIVRDIPVVEPHMAIALAGIIREAVVEIGQLRLSTQGRDTKAQKLFEYILSDEFISRFRAIAESVGELRAQQEKEREWHENTWVMRADLHERIESSRREVAAKLKAITVTVGGAVRQRTALSARA